jgi:hypothetical protein
VTRGAVGTTSRLALLFAATASTLALADSAPYPAMAPLTSYLEPSDSEEIAMARTAAPASISAHADILVLSRTGYRTARKGTNGFVCLVERSWFTAFADREFWNPNFRAPICDNRAAARTVLAPYLERTRWVLAGASIAQMAARTRDELSAGRFVLPETGAMSYMMSRHSHLHDADGHWRPHLMFYLTNTDAAAWGAGRKGSPILADGSTLFSEEGAPEPIMTFFVPVAQWSDGTPATEPGG